MLGTDRAFEILELLFLFFVILAAAMFVFLAIYEVRSRRALRRTNYRLEAIVEYLGRNVFGADGWDTLEQTTPHGTKRLDSLIELLDSSSFDAWARKAIKRGHMDPAQVVELKERLARPQASARPSADRPQTAKTASPDLNPAIGMPVAIRQADVQARGTIAELDARTITIWVMNGDDVFDVTKPATFMLLSRRGPYTFDSRLRKTGDGTLTIERPGRMVLNQRRRYDRRPAALPAMIKDHLTNEAPTRAVIDELSGGGATLTSPNRSFAVGSILKMSFSVGKRHYTAAGRVVRAGSDPSRLHVRFEAMNETERQEIVDYIAETELI